MKREDLLEKGFTEEQTTEILDMFHKNNSNITKANQDLQSQLDTANNKIAGLTKLENELNAIKQSQLSEQEKQEIARKETEKNLAESRRILNTAKAKEIFSEIGGVSDTILNAIVTDDENSTLANANALLTEMKTRAEKTINETKEQLSTLDIKPTASNVLNENAQMTWEKFEALTVEEQNKFAEEHPQEFNQL